MRFADFLPDLSLAFVLWSILGIISGLVLWLIVYSLLAIIPRSFLTVRFEHIVVWLIIFPLTKKILFLLDKFLFKSISFIASNYFLISSVLAAAIVWLIRKHIEKIFYWVDTILRPLAWLFAFLLVIAVPLSMFKTEAPGTGHLAEESASVTHSDEKHPNIILVTQDALSALDMQLYGYHRPTTPFISEWAKDAVVFNRAYSVSNWTGPTNMTLMSGQRVWTHRLWYRPMYHQITKYKNNLARVLKDNGYAVYSYVANIHAHPKTLGIEDDFLTKDDPETFALSSGWWFQDKLANFFADRPIVRTWIFVDNPIANQIESFRPDIYNTLKPPEIVYNHFLKQLSQRKSQRPFFAWIYTHPLHFPYLPPKPYMGTFGDADKLNTLKKQRVVGSNRDYKPEEQPAVDILRKRYDEFILYADSQFELFISRLSETIDMTNTIIILTSDHGDSFSHGRVAHDGPYLYESLVHIPLIIKMPGKIAGMIDTLVEQTDIAPTILDLTEISVPPWMDGRSLLPLIENKPFEPRPVFSMQLQANHSFEDPITKGTIAVWEGDYKLIYYLDDNEGLLFNLQTDPDETKNIFQEKSETAQKLMKLINDNLSLANKRITQSP
jgi:arylsulfatase A-like enzyme